MHQQHTIMEFDPANGEEKPYPSHADQWRGWKGRTAWLFNPWTGDNRHPSDIGSDCFGLLIVPPNEHVYADTSMELNRLELLAEDLEATHLWLDDKKVPRSSSEGEVFSLVGRIVKFKAA